MNLRTYYNTIFYVHWLCKIEIENSKAPTCCLVSIQQFVKRIFLGGKAEYIEASLRVAPCAKQWLFQPREPDGGPALCVTDYVMSVIGVIFQFAVTGRLLPVRPQLPLLDRRRYQLWTPTTTTTPPTWTLRHASPRISSRSPRLPLICLGRGPAPLSQYHTSQRRCRGSVRLIRACHVLFAVFIRRPRRNARVEPARRRAAGAEGGEACAMSCASRRDGEWSGIHATRWCPAGRRQICFAVVVFFH